MGGKILVVDDDPVVRILVTEFLGSHGYEVETLDNGSDCLRRMTSFIPDVLVVDAIMPDMNGFDVLRRMRDNPETARVPVVMLSADSDTAAVALIHQVTAGCYVTKPFGVREILDAVEGVRAEDKTAA